jgi:hypothetical protein
MIKKLLISSLLLSAVATSSLSTSAQFNVMQLPNSDFDARCTEAFVNELYSVYQTATKTPEYKMAMTQMRSELAMTKQYGINIPMSDRYMDKVSYATIEEMACSNYDSAYKLLAQYKAMTTPKFKMVRVSN